MLLTEVGTVIVPLASKMQLVTVLLGTMGAVPPVLPLTKQLETLDVPLAMAIQFLPHVFCSTNEFCKLNAMKLPDDVEAAAT